MPDTQVKLRRLIVALVVDDDPGVRTFTRQVLSGMGITVLEAADGPGALVAALAHKGPIDLLLADYGLPGFDGNEVARRLTELQPGLKVLFLSGYSERELKVVLPAGAVFLDKPFFASTLQSKVKELLGI